MTVREPQDHRPRKRAAKKVSPAVLAAEVDREGDEAIVVEHWGKTWHVAHPGDWRQSANDGMRTGDFNTWARAVLPAKEYTAWLQQDPTNREVGEFMQAFGEAAGVSLGESALSSPVLRRMAGS